MPDCFDRFDHIDAPPRDGARYEANDDPRIMTGTRQTGGAETFWMPPVVVTHPDHIQDDD